MRNIRFKAYGKINLGLDILRKREDGYHELQTVMQTLTVYDTLHLNTDESFSDIRVMSNKEELPVDSGNIVYKAIELIKREYNITDGVHAYIEKRIPIAAGMGGGSADAAAAVKAMNFLFGLKIPEKKLMEFCLELGADVPFCFMRGTALAEGIGERLMRLKMPPECTVLIAKPDINVSTKEVYEEFDRLLTVDHPDIKGIIKAVDEGSLDLLAASLGNVLEAVTAAKYQAINKIKKIMTDNGARASMMTGSGPTVFGIFDNRDKARLAKKEILKRKEAEEAFLTEWFNEEK